MVALVGWCMHLPAVRGMEDQQSGTVTLSNVALPVDQFGKKIITGEASVLQHEGVYWCVGVRIGVL